MHFLRNNNKRSKYYDIKFFNVYLTLCMYRNSFFWNIGLQHNLALLRQKIWEKFIIPGVLSETQIHHPLEYYRRPRFIIPWSTIGDPDSSSLEYYRRPRFIIPGVLSETQMIHHRSSLFTIEGPYSSLEILIYQQTPLYLIGHPYWSSETHTILLDTLWIPLENIIPHRRPIEFHRRPLCPIGAEPLIIIGDITFIFFIGIR